MAIYGPYTTGRLYSYGLDYTATLREMSIGYQAEMLDATVFGETTKVNLAGLKSITAQASGFVDLTNDGQDEQSFDNIGRAVTTSTEVPVIMMIPATAGAAVVEGDLAYFFQATHASYQLGGAHGQILPYTFSAVGDTNGYPLVRGYVGETGLTQRSAAGNGAGFIMGAVTGSQHLYGALVVTQSSGGTLAVTIESDDNAGFTSAVTKISFTSKTAIGSDYSEYSATIADTYYRVKWTLSAGTATFAVAMGIA